MTVRVAIAMMVATEVAQAAPPMMQVPCVTFSDTYTSAQDTRLVSDGQQYAICWSAGACHTGEDEAKRPGPAPVRVQPRVEPARICTGDRCDPIGPRAKAAIAKAGEALKATDDRGMLVIGDREVWARAEDRKLALPVARSHEGDVMAIDVVGDHLLVSRRFVPGDGPPPPWMSSRGAIIDAKGAVTGRIATSASSALSQTRVLALAGGQIVFNGAGGFALIVRGVPVAFGDLVGWSAQPAAGVPAGDPALRAMPTVEVPVEAAALAEEPGGEITDYTGRPDGSFRAQSFAYEWCSAVELAGCHVGEIQIVVRTRPHAGTSYGLRRTTEHPFPVCRR